MIEPPLTRSPPNALTPRRCACESRPLRVEPCPFLCAMTDLELERDVLDTNPHQILAVSVGAPVALAPLLLEDRDLRAAELVDHHAAHLGPRERAADLQTALAVHHEDAVELDLLDLLAAERNDLHVNGVAPLHAVLLAARLDDREH